MTRFAPSLFKSSFLKTGLLLLFAFSLFSSIQAQDLRHKANHAYKAGEYLEYKIYFHSFVTGNVSVGKATLKIKDDPVTVYGRQTYHIVGKGKTSNALGLFYKVDDRYESYVDMKTLAPLHAVRRVNEGGYIIDHDTYFSQTNGKAYFRNNKNDTRKTIEDVQYAQDIVSLIYYARTLDYDNAKKGDVFHVDFLVDDDTYSARLEYAGKENVDIGIGKFKCIKIIPYLDIEGVFNKKDPMVLYVTDDKNRIPLYGKSDLKVGNIKLELYDFDNLRNYFSSRIHWND